MVRNFSIKQYWRDISLSKKIYSVVSLMGFLIVLELLTLLFAMNTLTAVRAFVAGEGIWSKAQKDAVLNLQRYADTQDQKYYELFLKCLETPLGDSSARLELSKEKPDFDLVEKSFIRGGIHPDDIDGIVHLILNFRSYEHIAKAIDLWKSADVLLFKLKERAEELHSRIMKGATYNEISSSLNAIDEINDRLTKIETNFSQTLGEGSRYLERMLLLLLFLAVLTVEGAGFFTVISFNKNLSRSLTELYSIVEKISLGQFNHKIPVRSKDELGRLANIINKMTADIRSNIGKRERAENANRVKSLFLANMSHEIRTPLAAIMGFSELLKDKSLSEAERDQYVEIINRTSGSLTKIINDILDLSKVEAGHIEIEKTSFSLTELLADLKKTLEFRTQSKGIEMQFEGIGPLPELIYSDPVRIRQILMNLIGNAIKFTEKGQVKLTYEVRESRVQFRIIDSGIGISEEQGQVLFQSFRQVDNSVTRKYEGTGLGLVLSRRLANLLDGNVSLIKSTLNVGSTFAFHFKLEILRENLSEAGAIKNSPIVFKNSRSTVGKSVLLVEDVEDNRLLIQQVLTRNGFKVTTAVNGSEGVTKAMNDHFDLILMDIQMPIMDGYTATHHLRKLGYKKPIIALTAHAMKEDQTRCIEAGCNDYLTKPLHITSLLDKISRYSEPAGTQQELSL